MNFFFLSSDPLTVARREAPLTSRMTEGVEVSQTPRTTQSNKFVNYFGRASPETSESSETWSLSEMRTEQGQKESSKSEEQDDQEEESISLPEEAQCHMGQSHSEHLDGGWGWAVLAATMLVLALTLAFPSCIGIFYTDLQKEFQATNTETSWVPAIMTAVLHAGGPVCSILVERYGCRTTIMVGGILSGLGLVASSFAQTIVDLYIATGVVTGLGFCLSFQPAVTMVGHYFVRRRAFASALSSTGTALGLTILPLLSNYLLGQFGWRGSFLVLGGVVLNCCVCGAVMRPLGTEFKAKEISFHPITPVPETNGLHVQRKQEGWKERLQRSLSRAAPFLCRHLAFDLMRTHLRFRAYVLGVSWMMLGFLVPLVYLVPHATVHGIDQELAALLMAVLGLVNVAIRPTAAMLFGLKCISGNCRFVYVFAGALLVNGLSNCVCGADTSFHTLLAYVVVYGISMSIVGSLLFTVLMETVEMSRFQSALGLLTIIESFALLLGPPLAGVLVDCTGDYRYVFYFCTVSVSTAGLFIIVSFYWLDRQSNSDEKKTFPPENSYIPKPKVSLATDDWDHKVPLHRTKVQDIKCATDA
ncbi:monocarboxylate transporter 6 [Trichomycterus rosablanca]|uniref:monocarboxylate transporter 6 n=1 Tax=Trichomycterus rosablanca TaxID=2290929 RepID=UPI002F359FCF